jgi:hypothetical protein
MYTPQETRTHQQQRIERQVQRLQAYDYFNLLTRSPLLDRVDQHSPAYRERLYPPTETLSLFMTQTLNSDRACQSIVNRYAVDRHAHGLKPCSTHTGGYGKARQRLPLEMMRSLTRETGGLIARQAQTHWHGVGAQSN